ncbi:2-amino-4-hydroxy-6-hydroxymethyldihydropteridine diphosphokinase [Porticoccaceae bacterium]|nr:2-amino-4-hydroxy-6-hydroxymethyldihydropteridine diphosphokinase [Porticoccaceae bacterium]MDC1452675.1 2-amino-4-hydroxy-6-hydroxymethyldihydropteridine diphosphokinase [Porticoccaceae bacterium]
MALIYLSLGSNVEAQRNIEAAMDALADTFGELIISSVYESEAVGFDGDSFYNLVVGIHSDLGVGELSKILKTIEDRQGRDRSAPKFGARSLDIDILTVDDRVGVIDGIAIPRDEILKNAFVLQPLAEIAPTTVHPQNGLTYQQLWQDFDKAKQNLFPIEFIWRGKNITRVT